MVRCFLEDGIWYRYTPPVPGYVYAVQFDDGLVKIGSTSYPAERFHRLQFYYRNKKTRIDRVYISDKVEDSRRCERLAQDGLRAVEKKEIYNISFDDAVNRVKSATNTKDDFITHSREETEREFPDLKLTQIKYYQAMERIIKICQEAGK